MIPRIVIIGVLAIIIGLYYEKIGETFSDIKTVIEEKYGTSHSNVVWLEEKLVKYEHLAVFGHVFDVTSAPQFYGKDGHYNFFTGVDATRAFATSDMSEKNLIPTVEGLSLDSLNDAFNWLKEFEKKYPLIGYLHGPYFDATGRKTPYFHKLKQDVDVHLKTQADEAALYPFCNVQSSGNENVINCVEGFKEVRYPRLFVTPSQRQPRCACLTQNYLNTGRSRLYPGCKEFDRTCKFTTEEIDKVIKEFSLS